MKYLVMDAETSDLFDYTKPADAIGQPRLCETAMLFVDDDLKVEREIIALIKPEGWVLRDDSEAARTNGLTHEQLEKDGQPVREIAREYGAAIDERRVVVAFNALFDIKMMRAELRHCGYPDRFMQTRYMCVMQGSRQLVDARTAAGKKKAPNLDEACAFFGLEPEPKPHRAIHGARRALEILQHLHSRGAMPVVKDPYDKKKA